MIEFPGYYSKNPEAVRRRRDLTSSDKVAYETLAHLAPGPDVPFCIEEDRNGRPSGLEGLIYEAGMPRRTLQRSLGRLQKNGLVTVGTQNGTNTRYTVHLPTEEGCANMAQVARKTRANVAQVPAPERHGTGATAAQDPRHNGAPITTTETHANKEGQAPALNSTAPGNGSGNGDSQDADRRLVATYAAARGRPCRNGEAAKLLEAVREARAAGATDPLIAHRVIDAGDAAPWVGPNAAREAARELVRDWAKHLEPPRHNVAEILQDIAFTRRYERGEKGEREGIGLDRCRQVREWESHHAEVVAKACRWPDVTVE